MSKKKMMKEKKKLRISKCLSNSTTIVAKKERFINVLRAN
jgi:hypothetical protein